MHSHRLPYREDGEDKTLTAFANGDLSGDVRFRVPADRVEENRLIGGDYHYSVRIPAEALKELIGGWARDEEIRRLEHLAGVEFLTDSTR